MLKALVKWGLFGVALFVAGPIASVATSQLRGVDGGTTTPLLSTTPLLGVLGLLAAVAIAAAVGVLSARLVNFQSACFHAGMVLAWAAAGTGTIDAVARSSQSPSLGWWLAAEGALALAAGSAAAWFIAHAAGVARFAPLRPAAGAARSARSEGIDGPAADALTFTIALGSALVGAWVIGQNFLKGQAIAAAALGAALAAAVAIMVNSRARPWLILSGAMAAALVGPLVGAVMHGSSPDRGFLPAATTMTGLLRVSGVLPLDWLAGALMGVPLGLSLGGWIGDGRHPHTAPKAPPTGSTAAQSG
ncbi:MAG: hypothetical protein AB7K52_09780 [Phycisphaerales bacterium]